MVKNTSLSISRSVSLKSNLHFTNFNKIKLEHYKIIIKFRYKGLLLCPFKLSILGFQEFALKTKFLADNGIIFFVYNLVFTICL